MDKEFDQHYNDELHTENADPEEILDDVAYYRTIAANVYMLGHPDSDTWVLVDTAVGHYSTRIIAAVEKRFGDKKPSAIILTHGHFDHVGSANDLAKHWNIPIYIHEKEIDYVTEKAQYQPADPTMGGGLMSIFSILFPKKPVNLKEWVQPLPSNGEIPLLKDWRYIETPGHSPGHIVLYREKDGVLITGDAILTEKPQSTISTFIPIKNVYGPPAYFTEDWDAARNSVKKIAALKPNYLLTGHGLPMEGPEIQEQLDHLASNFDNLVLPDHKKN
ncbi:MBL fold metallo-hydrolase [Aquibacillus salsiterrae]|uniref:MBL fold metallo-hydrolase n=1 Tax=Aquibacillus salsiterrae TaxID=2950439 RepID=A0A9X3WDR5_9BACI|nr:MBL fold metallo-hydrolase [Aquibacillus salsiterrae]MDC3417148.1 MBL fold metallo-hydrolase [Aquibacillus salsiterrae]